jgi:SAM-dependent methyltransferase
MTTEQAPKTNEPPPPERFEPGERRADLMAIEHQLRYRWAAELAAGKAVLDAGCGTGYGSQILMEAGARRVVGIDVDKDALPNRGHENLEFAVADVHELPHADAEFDLVVCFEVIEHVERPNEAIAELARVLADDGVLLVSSPNRAAYPAGNPHHVYEYLPEELQGAISSHLSRTALYRQDAWLASTIEPRDEVCAGERKLAVSELGQAREEHEPYAIVVGTNGQLPHIDEQLMLGHPFEVQWWHDRLQQLKAEQARVRASSAYQLDQLREELRKAAEALIQVESDRVMDLEAKAEAERQIERMREAHDEAHAIIQTMQRTRAWRTAALYWELRARLLGRRPS